ncbi:MAG: GMC family oxidoreductase, partial [Verrucomicrobia bacterium]|nr:GMC family oxidoreductase [Verrucomicrobiota bacterium]
GVDSWTNSRTTLFGRQLKEEVRRGYGCGLGFAAQGSMVPNAGSFCELDPEVKDRWGIPVLRFHWKWTDFELNQVRHQQQFIRELLESVGAKVKAPVDDPLKSINPGGSVIHEVGGAIMGSDPGVSVTDRWGCLWDAKNVFVADGATFASTADKNPTLTIMAMAWRTADFILEQMRKGDL